MSTEYTYQEACAELGISMSTLKRAIAAGVLSPIKKERSITKYLASEQVNAFRGMPLKLAKQEMKQEESLQETRTPQLSGYAPLTTATYNMAYPDKTVLEYMAESGIGLRVNTPAGEMLFQPALVDETDSSNEEDKNQVMYSYPFLVAILLGLIVLLFVLERTKVESAKRVERTIEQIGLEKEDLTTHQREAIAVLRIHPKEVKELKSILEHENLLQVA